MTHPRIAFTFLFLCGAALLVPGCSPESKAQSTLEKYKDVFRICKEETEKTQMKPGEHRCSTVSSMAVEMSLKDSGLEDAKSKEMLSKWLDENGYKAYYIPPEKRAPEHR
jgi:hypothetical protein